MCAILGIAGLSAKAADSWFHDALAAMIHRGPDDHGIWLAPMGDVRLGHRRLSIIDLSPAGHQPLCDAEERAWIVFNGEIYNHVELRRELAGHGYSFRSSSDTEVLVNAYLHWGEKFVERLIGMFAFAIYDKDHRTILLGRDRAGEKPLFYSHDRGSLSFASELKALLKDPSRPRHLDPRALQHYLAFGCSPSDQSMLQGVRKLPPAHCLSFNLSTGAAKVWQYWQLPTLDAAARSGDARIEALSEEFEALFEDAVSRQMMADVPVGVLLSGGVDSSLVTALAVRHQSDLRTFTLSQPSAPEHDETEHARLIADHFGTRHTELVVADPDPSILDKLARQYDDPIGDSSIVPTYLISQAVRKECTVAVGGDAGDELFGGYARYNQELRVQQKLRWLAGVPLTRVAGTLVRLRPVGLRGNGQLRQLAGGFKLGHFATNYTFGPDERAELLRRLGSRDDVAEAQLRERYAATGSTGLDAMLRVDFGGYLPDDLLVKVDRASMLVSLEVRSPLLDHRVIEFAFSRVPDSMKATLLERKIFLKHLAKRILPPQFDTVRKQGFSVPIRQWLTNPIWRDYFREVLFESSDGLMSDSYVERLWQASQRGRNVSPQLFSLAMLQRWRQLYGVSGI